MDEYSGTSVPSIYAVGDVTDRIQLTPVAIREGQAFVETVFNGNPTQVDHELVPSAVFTQPELGTVGLTEEAGPRAGGDRGLLRRLPPDAAQPSSAARSGCCSSWSSRSESRRVLGCHIVAPGAGEMIQVAAVAVKMGATKEDFDRVTAVHPTMAEEIVTMRDAGPHTLELQSRGRASRDGLPRFADEPDEKRNRQPMAGNNGGPWGGRAAEARQRRR